MILINPSNCFTGIATSDMNVFVILPVSCLQLSTNITKSSNLGVVGVLYPPLKLYNVF